MDEQELQRIIDNLRNGVALTASELDYLNRAMRNAASETESFGKRMAAAGVNFARGIEQTAKEVRNNRFSFQSLNPLINGLSGLVGGVSGTLGVLTEKFGTLATSEIDKVVNSFNTLGSVGVTTGGGLTELYRQAEQAKLGLADFANLIAQNSQGLAYSFGTTLEGAEAIGTMVQSAGAFESQFQNLGIALNEQAEFFAYSQANQARLGRQRQAADGGAVEAAMGLAEELDLISRLTGQQRKAAQQALEQQLSDTRFREYIRKLEASGQGELAKQQRLLGQYLGVKGGRELQQGFQDALVNPGTRAAQEFYKIVGNVGGVMNDANVSTAEKIGLIQDNFERFRQAVPIEQIAGLGILSDGLINNLQDLGDAERLSEDQIRAAIEAQKNAKNTQDDNTKTVREAQQSLRNFGLALDKITRDVFPLLVTTIYGIAAGGEFTAEVIEKITDTILGDGDNPPDKRAFGGPVFAGTPYTIGEEGPEIFTPGISGRVHPTEVYESIMQAARDVEGASLAQGFTQKFLPGIGTLNEYRAGNITATMIQDLLGNPMMEHAMYEMYDQVVAEGLKDIVSGESFARASITRGDLNIRSPFVQTSGPRDSYRNSLPQAQDFTMTRQAAEETTSAQVAQRTSSEQMEEVIRVLNTVASEATEQNEIGRKMLRAYTS